LATLLLMHTSLCQAFQVELSPEVIMAAANVQDVSFIHVLGLIVDSPLQLAQTVTSAQHVLSRLDGASSKSD
jgi:hypothetical protein